MDNFVFVVEYASIRRPDSWIRDCMFDTIEEATAHALREAKETRGLSHRILRMDPVVLAVFHSEINEEV